MKTIIDYTNALKSYFGKKADVTAQGSQIQALTNYVTDTGVKNLLPNNATTQTVNGITFTANSDGTVTVNGTATGNAICWIIGTASDIFASGSYKLSGCPSGGSITTDCLRVYSGGNTVASDTGSGATFTNVSGAQIGIVIFSGTTMNNVVFKPMITKSDIPNSDYAHYQPYAKTNVELTQDVTPVKGSFTYLGATFNYRVYPDRFVIWSNGSTTERLTASDWTAMLSNSPDLASLYPDNVHGALILNNGDILKVRLTTGGTVSYFRVSTGAGAGTYIQSSVVMYA